MAEKIKVAKVYLSGHGEQHIVITDFKGLQDEVNVYWEGSEVDDEDMIIKLTMMDKEEVENLPEHEGW